mmetsp:Transcript_9952/g.20415  ORF Transcript_9952/g.20415 Transcript_9952/m.20415 type:complete len:595 (+) Transcript_9952:230-2014(+)
MNISNDGSGMHGFVGSFSNEVTACMVGGGCASILGTTSRELKDTLNFCNTMKGRTVNENPVRSAATSSWSSASSGESPLFSFLCQESAVPPLHDKTKSSSPLLDLNTNGKDCSRDNCSSPQAAVSTARSKIDPEKSSLSVITSIDKGFEGKGSFPMNLCLMLESVEKHNLTHIISWLPCGTGFLIHDHDAFFAEVLPKYFKSSQHTKLRSFYRKLNRWGFTVARAGPSKGAWEHEAFNRQKAAECLKIALETGKNDVFDALNLNHSRTSGSAGSNSSGGKISGKKKRQGSQLSSMNGGHGVATVGNSSDTFRRGSNFGVDDDDNGRINRFEGGDNNGNYNINSTATSVTMKENMNHAGFRGIGYDNTDIVHHKSASAINNHNNVSSFHVKAPVLGLSPLNIGNNGIQGSFGANTNNAIDMDTLIQASSSALSSSTMSRNTLDPSIPLNGQINPRSFQWSRSASFSSSYPYQNPTDMNRNNLSAHTNNILHMQRPQVNPCFETRASWTEGTSTHNAVSSNFQRYMPSRAFFPLNISELTREQLLEGESEDLIFDDEALDFQEESINPNALVSQQDQELAEFFERLAHQLDRTPTL